MFALFQYWVERPIFVFGWIALGGSLPACASSHFPLQQIEATARQFLAAQVAKYQLFHPEINVTVSPPLRTPFHCPSAWKILPPTIGLNRSNWKKIQFQLSCPGLKSKAKNRVHVEAAISAEVLVAIHSITANQALSQKDWIRKRQNITQTLDAVSVLPEMATLRQSVRSGQILQRRFLQNPPTVKRGESIQIQANFKEFIQVNAPGEALENGSMGDIIRVRNTISGKIIQTRVVSRHHVEPLQVVPHD